MSNTYGALEIRALREGGYIIVPVPPEAGYHREPVAAFSTLEEAVQWIAAHLLRVDSK